MSITWGRNLDIIRPGLWWHLSTYGFVFDARVYKRWAFRISITRYQF